MLSHLKAHLRDLRADEALSREQRQFHQLFYSYEVAKLELQLAIFDVKERIKIKEEGVEAAQKQLDAARSPVAHQESVSNCQARGASEAPAQMADTSDPEEINKSEARLNAARAALDHARSELRTLFSNLENLSLKGEERKKGEAETRKWEKSRKWETLTPEALQLAVDVIRHQFDLGCWNASECTKNLCSARKHLLGMAQTDPLRKRSAFALLGQIEVGNSSTVAPWTSLDIRRSSQVPIGRFSKRNDGHERTQNGHGYSWTVARFHRGIDF
jgi:hypothetical protein